MKIAYIINSSAGVCYHRLQIPFANLAGEEFQITETNGFADERNTAIPHKITDFDVVVFNRYHIQPELIIQAKKAGVKIVVDIDDFWHLPDHHIIAQDWLKNGMPQKVVNMLKLADTVWTTNWYLAKKISHHNTNVLVIPNAIDFAQAQFNPVEVGRSDRFSIGWAGSEAHNRDLYCLSQSIRRLHETSKIAGKYCMMLGGFALNENYKMWIEYEKIFDNKKDPGSYLRIMKADVHNYAVMYNYMDVALAPLVDDSFNNCKSNLKMLEAGALGIPIIASDVVPYSEVLDRVTGFKVKNNKHDWYKHINWFIRNPKAAKEMGANLQGYVKENYNIDKVNELRKQSLRQL